MNSPANVFPRGTLADPPYSLVMTPDVAGWRYTSLRVIEISAGSSVDLETGDEELIVLPLSGSCTVACDGKTFSLAGREDVFSSVSDFAYVPRDAQVTIASADGGRFAVPGAKARERLSARYVAGGQVAVELRGAGQCSRQINNFCSPDGFEADRLIAVEVLTPGGNWSSYPPHKHDEDRGEEETPLEEIYYFEVARDGVAYQRAYGSGAGREIDVCVEVRSGDVITMPHGYHGPSMAAPGYDLYYLNVMAGAADRAWRFRDDPTHTWIRETWITQEIDPRLPMTSPQGKSN
jgi:5-deoxy-glucuronate isomerase